MKSRPAYILILDGERPFKWKFKGVEFGDIKSSINEIQDEAIYESNLDKFVNFELDILLQSSDDILNTRIGDIKNTTGVMIKANHSSFNSESALNIRNNYARLCEILRSKKIENGNILAEETGFNVRIIHEKENNTQKWMRWINKKTRDSLRFMENKLNIDRVNRNTDGNYKIIFKTMVIRMAFVRRSMV